MENDPPVEPRWIDLDPLKGINERVVAATGEPFGLRDAGRLAGAWAQPIDRCSYEGENDLVGLVVALMLNVARNHPFQQGNTRTGFQAGLAFLGANGLRLDRTLGSAAFADAFVELTEHRVDEAAFAERRRRHVVPRG